MKKKRLLGAMCIYAITCFQSAFAININLQTTPMTIGADSLSFSFDGINASVSGYHVEYDPASTASDKTTIYGPFSTSTAFTSGGNVFPIFGRVTDSSGTPINGLSLTSSENLGQTGDDLGQNAAPGFDNTLAGGTFPGSSTTLDSFQFALFIFDAPINISEVIVDDVSNFNRDIWVAGGSTAPDLSSGFLSAFSGFSVINSTDDATGGFFTHAFSPIQNISYLAIGAPPDEMIGDLGSVISNSTNTQFYIQGLTVSAIPIPAAVWLFSSGLLCIIGIARSRKSA